MRIIRSATTLTALSAVNVFNIPRIASSIQHNRQPLFVGKYFFSTSSDSTTASVPVKKDTLPKPTKAPKKSIGDVPVIPMSQRKSKKDLRLEEGKAQAEQSASQYITQSTTSGSGINKALKF